MQATVSRYDTETFSGAVLTDTGVELPFTVHAVAETPVRLLRLGQRVRLETTGAGADLAITRSTSSPSSENKPSYALGQRRRPVAPGGGDRPSLLRVCAAVLGQRGCALRRSLLGGGLLGRRLLGNGPSCRPSWPAAFLATPSWPEPLAGAFLAAALPRRPSWPAPSWRRLRAFLRGGLDRRGLLRRSGRLGGGRAGFGATSFGSFFAPETTAFSSAPARNFGTTVFLALDLTGPRVADHACRAIDGLEGTETGDGDLAALLGQLALDGVDHRLQCVLGLAAVSVEVHCERFDQLALVHCLPSVNWASSTALDLSGTLWTPHACTNTNAAIRPCFQAILATNRPNGLPGCS